MKERIHVDPEIQKPDFEQKIQKKIENAPNES